MVPYQTNQKFHQPTDQPACAGEGVYEDIAKTEEEGGKKGHIDSKRAVHRHEDGTQCNMDTVSAENGTTTSTAPNEAQEKPRESLNLSLHRTDGESNEHHAIDVADVIVNKTWRFADREGSPKQFRTKPPSSQPNPSPQLKPAKDLPRKRTKNKATPSESSQESRRSARLINRVEKASYEEAERASSVPVDHNSDPEFQISSVGSSALTELPSLPRGKKRSFVESEDTGPATAWTPRTARPRTYSKRAAPHSQNQ
ncbi:hypothetical protein N7540_003502 [Penicillium herquei]|nr:hypothetical protein N7540_003502 [Penicillium herquei]